MATHAFAVVVMLAALIPAAHAAQDCELNGARVDPANVASFRGRSGVIRCRDRDSGLLVLQQEVRDGRFVDGYVGLARTFHADGSLRRATFYGKPGAEQAYAEFNERGQLAALRCTDRPVLAPAVDDERLCGFGDMPWQVELFSRGGELRSRVSYAQGRLLAETLFDAAGKAVREREWDRSGKLLIDEEVVSGAARKTPALPASPSR